LSHISQLETILETLTSYAIVLAPNNPTEGIILVNGDNIPENNPYEEIEEFIIVIRATSLVLLETYISKFYTCRSILPTGYHFTTAGQPAWINIYGDKKPYTDTEFSAHLKVIARWPI